MIVKIKETFSKLIGLFKPKKTPTSTVIVIEHNDNSIVNVFLTK